MKKYHIFIITGVCGVGKTSIIPLLKEELTEFEIFDFDEAGVPKIPTTEWRTATTRLGIEKCFKNLSLNKRSILLGMIIPQDVELFVPRSHVDCLKFLLLNVTQEERTRRLESRKEKRQFVLNERKNIEHLENWLNESVFDYGVIDTTKQSIDETADKVIRWVIHNSNITKC